MRFGSEKIPPEDFINIDEKEDKSGDIKDTIFLTGGRIVEH